MNVHFLFTPVVCNYFNNIFFYFQHIYDVAHILFFYGFSFCSDKKRRDKSNLQPYKIKR